MDVKILPSGAGVRIWVAVLIFSSLARTAAAWDFSGNRIPTDEILSGGPPKDGIPALFDPKFVPAGEADFMEEQEAVLGLEAGGVSRAYPLRILSWHELVNDTLGGLPLLVSW